MYKNFKSLLQDRNPGGQLRRFGAFLYIVVGSGLILWAREQELPAPRPLPPVVFVFFIPMAIAAILLVTTDLKGHPRRYFCALLSSTLIMVALFVNFHRLLIVACAVILSAGLILWAEIPRLQEMVKRLGGFYREISKDSKS